MSIWKRSGTPALMAGAMGLAVAFTLALVPAQAQQEVSSSVQSSALVLPDAPGMEGGPAAAPAVGTGGAQAVETTPQGANHNTDYALMFITENPAISNQNTPRFFINGAALNVGFNFVHGFGMVVDVAGDTGRNPSPGLGFPAVSLSKISYMFGPRYTYTLKSANGVDFFGELLMGGAHAWNGNFPSNSGTVHSENGFQSALGGGADLPITPRFAVRLLEFSWLHNTLPNVASNSRNEMRIGVGVRYRR